MSEKEVSDQGIFGGKCLLNIDLVIPVFNEATTLPYLRSSIELWRSKFDHQVSTILIDDGSIDSSGDFLRKWALEDRSMQVLFFSRNFGHQIAVTAGLTYSRGDVAVILDADLQDPLEVIPLMVEKYREGYDIVYGKREERQGETLFKQFTAWSFYRVMRTLVYRHLPADTGDFRLVSRRCIDVLRSMPEGHRFLRGLFAWMGFKQAAVNYVRHPRHYGQTKYPLGKMLRFAANAMLSFSPLPIRVISMTGLLIAVAGFAYGLYVIARWYWVGDTVAGWPSLIVIICVLGGAILISLGILGEYISRIYEAVKQRPLYIISETINFKE